MASEHRTGAREITSRQALSNLSVHQKHQAAQWAWDVACEFAFLQSVRPAAGLRYVQPPPPWLPWGSFPRPGAKHLGSGLPWYATPRQEGA
jgi:hypothetical protein